eukprot:142671_1
MAEQPIFDEINDEEPMLKRFGANNDFEVMELNNSENEIVSILSGKGSITFDIDNKDIVHCRGFKAFPTFKININIDILCGYKYYYEIELITNGIMQIGFHDNSFECYKRFGNGVGDDIHSWAFDGGRICSWNGLNKPYGRSWKEKDCIGIGIDLSNKNNIKCEFFMNGLSLGIAYKNMKIDKYLYPSFTLEQRQCVNILLNENKMKYYNIVKNKYKYKAINILNKYYNDNQYMKTNKIKIGLME